MKSNRLLLLRIVGPALIVGFGLGWWFKQPASVPSAGGSAGAVSASLWTCSMHPQIQLPKPGACPICGMDLIPVRSDRGPQDSGPRQLRLSAEAVRLAQVAVWPVERRFPLKEVRMVGKLDYDETRLASITAWVPGRLDRLYVDYTGVPVRQGDHLVSLYSPALLTAQEELLQALQTAAQLQASPDSQIQQGVRQTIASAREKLRLWGLTPAQVQEIESSGRASDHLTIYSPQSGIVVAKEALEGMYVNTGTRIYSIADLSHLWVKLDAYESDLAWLHYGQEMAFTVEAYPGQEFKGRIAFIDPTLNPSTRTVKVRVNVHNQDGRLKPEMFVRAVVRSRVAAEGKIVDPDLAGKWISPMHPEIIKDGPGQCDICGMDLVPAADLGYWPADAGAAQAPLVIPASAPLITGRRAVVYLADTNQPGLFEGRDIVLGPRAGDAYLVKEGLREGELVVVRGNFKIDSAVQIQAGPSMMNPAGGLPPPGHPHDHGAAPSTSHPSEPGAPDWSPVPAPASFQAQLTRLLEAYYHVQQALAADQWRQSADALRDVQTRLQAIDTVALEEPAREVWTPLAQALSRALDRMQGASDWAARRDAFEPLSENLWRAVRRLGLENGTTVRLIRCPMAFQNRGARWLQAGVEIRNPYFGSEMLQCGAVVETWPAPTTEP